MTPSDDELAQRLKKHIATAIVPWPKYRGGWPGEADAALVDAVFSTRARYDTVVLPLVERWRDWKGRPSPGNLSALVCADRSDIMRILDNDQYVPGGARGKHLKVDAAIDVARRLVQVEKLDTADQILAEADQDAARLRATIERTFGVGPAQSAYFLMLLGVEGVKADTLVTSYVEHVVGCSGLGQPRIEAVVRLAAEQLSMSQIEVDHAIWRTESNARRQHRRRRAGA